MSVRSDGVEGSERRVPAGLVPLLTLLAIGLVLRPLFIGSDAFHDDVSALEAWTLALRDDATWQLYANPALEGPAPPEPALIQHEWVRANDLPDGLAICSESDNILAWRRQIVTGRLGKIAA